MRKAIMIILFFSFYMVVFNIVSPQSSSAALIADELSLTEIDQEEQNELWKRFSFQKTEFTRTGEAIQSFDASETMGVLLLTTGNYLLHLDQEGNIVESFHFEEPGTAGVAWDSSDICLFITRGSLVMKLSSQGELKEIKRMAILDYDMQKKWNSLAFRKETHVGSDIYYIQQAGLFSHLNGKFTRLVYIDAATGDEYTLYDESNISTKRSIGYILLGANILVVSFLIAKHQKDLLTKVKRNVGQGTVNAKKEGVRP